MDKLKMHTPDKAEENFRKLSELFPNAVTETINDDGEVVRAIDKDVLMQEISAEVVDGPQERYQFTWPDKRKSVNISLAPIAKTLRLDRKHSVGSDGTLGSVDTKNIYIEGDNLDVLKLLQETYLGKVKIIYIDPPYNTGKDFIYKDSFFVEKEEYEERSGQTDEEGNRLVSNTETNGQFHTDWLNMIYPRLRLAKDLLTEDGVIFISIDDHEQENLKKMCTEIFGERNFIAQIVWERAFAPVNLKKHFSESHDYILCFAKNKEKCVCNGLPRTEEANSRYSNPDNDPRGDWASDNFSVGPAIKSNIYPITTPSGIDVYPPSGYSWRFSQKRTKQLINENRVWFGQDGKGVPRLKRFLSDVKQGITPMTIWKYEDVGHSQEASKNLKALFDGKAVFDYPKPVKLIKQLIQLYDDKDAIIMDFFAGSATTAQAVMELNSEDNGKRKYIMVQLPEKLEEGSNAYEMGLHDLGELGRERIVRAANQIRESAPLLAKEIDLGFRRLVCDSSNMLDVYYKPDDYEQEQISMFADNIKADRTPEDLLIQVMLDLGILLSSKIEEIAINGKKVFSVADGYLLACFDSAVNEETVTEIAKREPFYAVFRDSSIATDSVATNFDQIFETYSPKTQRKVL